MKRRRTKRPYEYGKRCHCPKQRECAHHWWVRVYAAGVRQRIDLTALYPTEPVEVAAAKAKDEVHKGLIVNGSRVNARSDSRVTFGDIADHYVTARGGHKHYYLDALRASTSATGTKLDVVPADDMTTADIKRAVAAWRARPRAKAGAKGGAVAERHLLQTVRHLFNWAIAEGYASRTPFKSPQGVNLIHVKASKGRSRRLEPGEESRLLAAADPYIADFFVAMIETGCRPGELRTLQWSEVREDALVVLSSKAKDREERRVPIMPTLRAILDRRRIGPDGVELPLDAHVFGDDTGKLLSRRKVCGLWQSTCARAKVKNLHLHDLRAEAGSQLLEAGVAIHDVRDALGHSSTTMTSTYLRGRTDSLTKAYQQRATRRARMALRLAHVGQSGAKRKSS